MRRRSRLPEEARHRHLRRRIARRREFRGDIDVAAHHRDLARGAVQGVALVGVAAFAQQGLGDPQQAVRAVAESAMREIIGQTKIQSALTEARGQIQDDTRKLMQSILDEYKAGVIVNNVQLQKVDPPTDVVDAFNDVQRARQEKEKLRNEAEAYRNDIIPRAKGESEKLRQQALGYQQEVVNRAKGDADRFTKVYEAYRNSEDVTAERMYLETMEQVLQNSKLLFMDSRKGGNVLPYLPLNELQRTPKDTSQTNPLSEGLSQPDSSVQAR